MTPDDPFAGFDRLPDGGTVDGAEWPSRSVRSLARELRRRRRRLEASNPLTDRDGYIAEFGSFVALQAHLRDRSD